MTASGRLPRGAVRALVLGDRAVLSVLAGALTVLLAATVTAFVGVSDPSSADTVITSVTRAVVALPDGSEHPATIGELLPREARLRTGEGGGARLTTAGRDVYVGALSTVRVLDGVRETLERGQVMVDSRNGPELELGTLGGTVASRAGALTRVERGGVLRVAVFEGAASFAVDGRQATTMVPALHQVTAQYGGQPGTPTALALTGDAWEQRLAAGLTAADADLRGLQSGLRGSDGAVVLAAARRDLLDASASCPAAADRGERALSLAVGQVARATDSPLRNLASVCTARGQGGSWGVVAAIVQASVTDVSAQLTSVIDIVGTPPTFVAGGEPDPGTVLSTPSPTPGTPGSPSPSPTRTRGPGDPTKPPQPPTPSPGVVDEVVTLVTDLLPTPTPLPVGPSATPLLQIGPLTIDLDLG